MLTDISMGLALAGLLLCAQGEPRKVVVPTVGLTEAGAPIVERALRALEGSKPPKAKVLSDLVLHVDQQRLELTLALGQELRLTQLDAALVGGSAKVNREKLLVPGGYLLLEGKAGEDAAERLRKALSAKGLYKLVEARPVEGSEHWRVDVRGGGENATVDSVAKAVQSAVSELRLVDVAWQAPRAERPQSKNLSGVGPMMSTAKD